MINVSNSLELLRGKFESWIQGAILILPNAVLAGLIIIAFHYISGFVRSLVEKILRKYVSNKALVNFVGILVRLGTFLMGFLLAINILKLDEAVFSVLAGVGIVGLAIGFAFQDVAANFIAGIALVIRKDYPFRVGDIIETNGQVGVIEAIHLRDTMMRTFQGQSIFIPNKQIFENAVINFSLMGKRRIDLAVGVSYGDDLEQVRDVTIKAVRQVSNLDQTHPVELYFEEFGDSSINFQLHFWVTFHKQRDYLKGRDEAIRHIKRAYNQSDICIPFPIRTLDFGIKGGERLSTVVSELSRKGT